MKNLYELWQTSGISHTEIAKGITAKGEIRLDSSTVSKIISGKYEIKNQELMKTYQNAIRKYLESTTSTSEKNEKWYTKDQDIMKNFVLSTKNSNYTEYNLIIGKSGVGKTTILEEIAQDSDVIYVKMRENMSVGDIYATILHKMGKNRKGSINDKHIRTVESLKADGINLLIIDEADVFTHNNEDVVRRKLEVFRELYEEGINVVVVGLPKIVSKLKSISEDYINRRFTFTYTMSNLSRDELNSYWCDVLGFGIDDVAKSIIDNSIDNGFFGTLKNVKRAYDKIGDVRIASQTVFNLRRVG